ncbi:DUF3800 domain-containing protein [Burkholderia ubonensis]|uniref:DUF3800 domain-containing protein n=1 Tax=Burkholderia ubonensis TaxID=101571 RepID=UPI0018E05F99
MQRSRSQQRRPYHPDAGTSLLRAAGTFCASRFSLAHRSKSAVSDEVRKGVQRHSRRPFAIELSSGSNDRTRRCGLQLFRRFEYEDGQAPEYLQRNYGILIKSGTNLGKILYEDFEFVDSDCCAGVQVADLVAGGVRRLLRGGFEDRERIALALGGNMLQREHNAPPIILVSLDQAGYVAGPLARLLRMMGAATRPMLTPGLGLRSQ